MLLHTLNQTPTSTKSLPFFTELGSLLNLVRNFNTILNDETAQQHISDNGLSYAWYQTNPLISKLQNKLSELEAEIAYFFKDYSTYKTNGSKFNLDVIQQQFIPNFRKICNEYFSLKSNSTYNQIFDHSSIKESGAIYKMHTIKLEAVS
jgi:hypothetical protein